MPKVTSKDVARAAGVSQSTVSYVLTGKRPISDETRRRVQAAMARLTYEPNAGARALASQRSRVIGLVVPFEEGTDTAGLLPFIETIAALARAHDHEVLLVTSSEGPAALRRLAGRSLCDGIVVMDVRSVDERVPVAASLSIPVILIGVPRDRAGLPCVDMDYAGAGELAVKELARTGHERLAILGYPSEVLRRDLNFVHRALDAATRAARRCRLPFDLVSPVEPGRAGAQAAVDRVLAGHGRERLGLVVPSSQIIQPVLHALTARGIRPGRDVSFIGFCPDDAAEDMEPPVTNVSNAPREVSRRAMETIFRLLDATGPEPASGVELLPPRLTDRGTVMPSPRKEPRGSRGRAPSTTKQQPPGRSPRPGTDGVAAGDGAPRRDHE